MEKVIERAGERGGQEERVGKERRRTGRKKEKGRGTVEGKEGREEIIREEQRRQTERDG